MLPARAPMILCRERFTHVQNTYAQAMSKFGLVRGKEGSKARHRKN